MSLNQLKPAPGSRQPKRIVGRGEGSTLGQTCGKGQKGQRARAGDGKMVGFEGGQTPLMRRVPKRGFRHPSKIHYRPVNLEALAVKFPTGTTIDAAVLVDAGFLAKASVPFKVLGKDTQGKTFHLKAAKISLSAAEAVRRAGGSVSS